MDLKKLLNPKNILSKVLVVQKIVVPLHPLSRSTLGANEETSSLKDLHRQRKK